MFDATNDGNVCPQYDVGTASAVGDEDCLNINVYTPQVMKVGLVKVRLG